jgi:pyruvate dehydrogenase E2 component (dihydrolipoamide acetyltransferase)
MAETITMPKLGFDMNEGTLVRWVKQEGENILKGDVLAEIETDKATVEVESSASGVVRKLLVDQGSVVPIGAPIAIVGSIDEKIEVPAESEPQNGKQKAGAPVTSPVLPAAPPVAPKASSTSAIPTSLIKASPLAKKIARDRRVDLSRIQGTGPGNRIIRMDVEAALVDSARPSGPKAASAVPFSSFEHVPHEDETVGLTKLRQAIARRMAESKATVPHFYVTREFKMDALMVLRRQANDLLPEEQKLSVNDFVTKAAGMSLRQFPNLNASFDGDKVVRHGAVNVGVAVAIEGGLLTVVNRDTDLMPLRQIAMDLKRMVAGAREGKVRPDDIQGSTFSISNLGMYDVENFIAIVNPPEAAILAVGVAQEKPVVENGEIKIGWRMNATISVDHRVSDGAEAARFMQVLATYLEQPLRLLV